MYSSCLPLVSLNFCTVLMTLFYYKDFRNRFGANSNLLFHSWFLP